MMVAAQIIRLIFAVYMILIFIRVLLAWVRPNMFNPIVQFVYKITDPYLRIFARIKFLRIGYIDFTPILALYVLYLVQELTFTILFTGIFTSEVIISKTIETIFKFVYFIIFIFIITVGLRFIFEIIGFRTNNVFVSIIYSISEPAVRPFSNLFKIRERKGFDFHVLISLSVLIILQYLILKKILEPIILTLISRIFH